MAAHSDSRKRTLEALEKRFAIAKAEIFNKEKANKITLREHVKPSHPHPAPSASPNAQKPNPKPKPQPSPTPNKGNFSFFVIPLSKKLKRLIQYMPNFLMM